MGEREIDVGQCLANDLAGDALVRRIDVGVQEAHRDRLDLLGGERAAGLFDAGTVERLVHLTGGEQPLVDLAREPPRHQRAVLMK